MTDSHTKHQLTHRQHTHAGGQQEPRVRQGVSAPYWLSVCPNSHVALQPFCQQLPTRYPLRWAALSSCCPPSTHCSTQLHPGRLPTHGGAGGCPACALQPAIRLVRLLTCTPGSLQPSSSGSLALKPSSTGRGGRC